MSKLTPIILDDESELDDWIKSVARSGELTQTSDLEDVLTADPARVVIYEEDRIGDVEASLAFNFNPVEFEESIGIEWNRLNPPGADYSRTQFVSSGNRTIDIELHWFARHPDHNVAISTWSRELLLSWCRPRFTSDHWSLGPPKLILMWGAILPELRCYLIECRIRNVKFSHSGGVLRWVASCKFEQIPQTMSAQETVTRAAGDAPKRRRRGHRKEPPLDLASLADITAKKRGYGVTGEWELERVRVNQHGASGDW